MDFKIKNIKKDYKDSIHKLIEKINLEDQLKYSLSDEWLDYVIENAGEGIFLGFDGKKLAGMGTAMINPLYKNQATLNVVVDPSYRKKGLGGQLYEKIYDFVKGERVEILEAYVKERLVHGLSFAEKRDFNLSMYSWEMEKDLRKSDFDLKEKKILNFRRASEKDCLAYRKIIFNVFQDDLGEDALGQTLKDPSNRIYILEKKKEPIGSATVQMRNKMAYIYDIGVLQDYRGQGLGFYLLKALLRSLKEEKTDKASLLVTGENTRALGLYRKIGFREVDRDLIMVKSIKK